MALISISKILIRLPLKILAFLLLAGFSGTLQATEIYPQWFLYPKDYPGYITGYTYNGMPAITDAANMYCAFEECIVVGTLEVFEDGSSRDLLKNSNYFYYFSPDSVEAVSASLKPVDKIDVSAYSHDQIFLFTRDSVHDISAERIKAESLPVPEWKDRTFFERGPYYYGVGMYTAIGNENDAWKTAEEQAVFNILNALSIEVHKIQVVSRTSAVDRQSESLDQISFIKLKFLLKHIQIRERFPDRAHKLFYVLVRIPKNGIIAPQVK